MKPCLVWQKKGTQCPVIGQRKRDNNTYSHITDNEYGKNGAKFKEQERERGRMRERAKINYKAFNLLLKNKQEINIEKRYFLCCRK